MCSYSDALFQVNSSECAKEPKVLWLPLGAAMAPRNIDQTMCSVDDELPETINQSPVEPAVVAKRPPMRIVWRNVIWFFFLHGFAVYGLYLLPFAKPATWLWGKI